MISSGLCCHSCDLTFDLFGMKPDGICVLAHMTINYFEKSES